MGSACVLVLGALVAVFASVAGQSTSQLRLPLNYHFISPGKFKRSQELACNDPRNNQPGCNANSVVLLVSHKYNAHSSCGCGSNKSVRGVGSGLLHLSDKNLHINAHFIGKRNAAMSRDFTWIQALGFRFSDHRLYMAAQKTAKWNNDVDRLELALDDEPIRIPAESGARWESVIVPGLSIMRTAMTNSIRVQLKGVFDIIANVVPITQEDSRIHNYGVTEDDSLAHFDLGFKFYDLSDNVHGVLGQTYRADYTNKLDVSSNMPIMGGAPPKYVSSDIFSTDCVVASWFGATNNAGISMVTSRAY
ncbi:hypothetical protein PR202_ga08189 [Eleusine coracana subsp. coracana]|uniref:Uncharacterized protein n=1 Tax=Eleusine coracana subsp. coracana TaxID=191504 RepID=A0AAV5C2J6_ELECO|nr:hypothetical protein PR202_ga08189 [Eleusine coracana subsp. coracana]